MANLSEIKVSVSLNGPIDVEKIAEEVKESIRKEIARVGIKAEPLKVGDYAKVVSICGGDVGGVKEGSIVVVKHISNGFLRYMTLDGNENGMLLRRFIKATDEEVAEAKRKLAEKAEVEKWAKIGRKPGEFKKGDIVRVTGSCFGHKVGTIGELVAAPEYIGTDLGVLANGVKKSHIGQMELIAPAESRFDSDAE
jgi:hypothetical protein